jgi:hypothetical protein
MEKTFQYHQQTFAGLELEIYNDLLKKDKIFLQCTTRNPLQVNLYSSVGWFLACSVPCWFGKKVSKVFFFHLTR